MYPRGKHWEIKVHRSSACDLGDPIRFWWSCLGPLVYLLLKLIRLFGFPTFRQWKGYFKNVSFALNLISKHFAISKARLLLFFFYYFLAKVCTFNSGSVKNSLPSILHNFTLCFFLRKTHKNHLFFFLLYLRPGLNNQV